MAQKNVTRDMTQGSPLKLILTFSLPLLGGFLFQQLYSFVDTVIVGRCLGTDALGAVGTTYSLNFLILGFVLGSLPELFPGFPVSVPQWLMCVFSLALGGGAIWLLSSQEA